MANHLRDQLVVATQLRDFHGIDVSFLVFRPDHARSVAEHGFRAIVGEATPGSILPEISRWRSELASLSRGSSSVAAVRALLPPIATEAAIARKAVLNALTRVRPVALLVGNPCTLEGRIAAAAASRSGCPVVAIQHGDILRADPLWQRVQVDRMFAWGDRSAAALEASGLHAGQILVTGAPWVDSLTPRPDPASVRSVLVALSGAGHQVGLREHAATVERIVAAASLTGTVRWRFRLHPKDDPALWARMIAKYRPSSVEVLEARSSKTSIHDDIADASLLLTVASTSGLDALLFGVPVVSLDRPVGEPLPDFASEGASTRVGLGEDLSTVVLGLCSTGESRHVRDAALRYARAFFGPLDGRATRRAAAALADVIRGGT